MTTSRSVFFRPVAAVVAVLMHMALLGGCAAPRYQNFPVRAMPHSLSDDPSEVAPRELPIFIGRTGAPIRWRDVLEACNWAEIILVGEQHDDGMGHAVQLAVVEDVSHLGALAMEMLERDEQMIADDYLEDIIDAETFVRLTHSADWSGKGSWEEWYHPIVDAAKGRGAHVIAANVPRRYVRLPRLFGYQRLRQLSADRRATFDLPRASDRSLAAYRARFHEVMRHGHGEADEHAADDPHREHRIDAGFRSQLLWDATMADSIVRARPRNAAKVVHLVGQFHSDFDGGLVQEIRARKPGAKILNISLQREWRSTMREEDRGRADIVIYTGERPPAEDAEDDANEDEDV